MSKGRLLVVDDEPNAREGLRTLLTEEGYEVLTAIDGEDGLERLQTFAPDVTLADVRMPRMDGVKLVRAAREKGIDCTFVMMTAFASVETAVDAMRAGAENFLVKPLDFSAVLVLVERALDARKIRRDAQVLRERVREQVKPSQIVGQSTELRAVFDVVERTAPTKATVLVLGESGTGKELVAQAIHELSPRKDSRFVKVHCAALSESLLESELFGHERGAFTGAIARREGRFELADGGTLFLDEVGEISASVQVKLLRVLQTREFERVGGTQTLKCDVRIVTATNRDLVAEVKAGRFREDLYYRLNVVAVTLPPLRRRKDDIPALVSHFIDKYAKAYDKPVRSLFPGTLQTLIAYDWPGNVRELENVIERAVVLSQGTEIGSDDLPAVLRGARPDPRPPDGPGGLIPGATLHDIEREAILRTLEHTGGSTAKAAQVLDISVRKIQYRLKEYAAGKRIPGGHPDDEDHPGSSDGA